MSSRFSLAVAAMVCSAALAVAAAPPLRVCSEPNNLPFSSRSEQGFENALAQEMGRDIHRDVQFVWLPQSEPHAEEVMLKSPACELVMASVGPAAGRELSIPYYRSSYVFISRRDRNIGISSLDDPRLADLRIGAQVIDEADAAAPPAQELARRGLARNIVGYSVHGRPLGTNSAARMASAVENGKIDMAIEWGPSGGYFAKESPVPLEVTAICAPRSASMFPVAFNVSMSVREGSSVDLQQINGFISSHQKQIRALLLSYGVPLLDGPDAPEDCP